MRPLPPIRIARGALEKNSLAQPPARYRAVAPAIVLLATGAWTLGCGGGGAGSVAPPATPPPSIQIEVLPRSGTVLLGGTLLFTATVSNAARNTVTWSVNGTVGGSSQAGLISADGLYTAPADLPQGGTVQVTATSNADSSKSASASVVISSDISVSMAPSPPSVELGATQTFHAAIVSNGRPDPAVRWSLNGIACPSGCGTIDASGNYTAPRVLPSPANLQVIATSVADPTKQSFVALTVTSSFGIQLSGPNSLQPGGIGGFLATLVPVSNSNPSSGLWWSLSGAGCSGASCGTLTVVTTQSSGGSSFSSSANYTAPATVPQPDTVAITVTAAADPTKKAQATVAIQPSGSLSLAPLTVTLATNHRITLLANGNGLSGASLNWSVNGVPGGNSTVVQLCVSGSTPCQPVTNGTETEVEYLAPGSVPTVNPVSVTVTHDSNPYPPASSQISIINHVVVSVLPNNVTLSPLGAQTFTASVLGSSNQDVIWQIQGTSCAAGACGSITSAGAYTAPPAAPSPDTLQIIATSEDDTLQHGQANALISSGANIVGLHPASVYAGGLNGFTLRIDGSGFVPSNPGPGSTAWVGGSPRVTTCNTGNSCTAPITSADVAQSGTLSVQIHNADTNTSNTVQMVIVEPVSTESVIELTSASPKVTGRNVAVVQPTTAGLDSDEVNLDLEVAAIGLFVTSTNTCNLAGNPIPLQRPSSGTSTADICLFSQAGFDTSMSYRVSGAGDIVVISKQPAGLGIIHITLEIPASAALGARTLFIQNANLDLAAASGVLEVH